MHKARIVADLESKDQALSLLPPLFHRVATVVALEQFGMEDFHRTAGLHVSQLHAGGVKRGPTGDPPASDRAPGKPSRPAPAGAGE